MCAHARLSALRRHSNALVACTHSKRCVQDQGAHIACSTCLTAAAAPPQPSLAATPPLCSRRLHSLCLGDIKVSLACRAANGRYGNKEHAVCALDLLTTAACISGGDYCSRRLHSLCSPALDFRPQCCRAAEDDDGQGEHPCDWRARPCPRQRMHCKFTCKSSVISLARAVRPYLRLTSAWRPWCVLQVSMAQRPPQVSHAHDGLEHTCCRSAIGASSLRSLSARARMHLRWTCSVNTTVLAGQTTRLRPFSRGRLVFPV